MLVLWGLWKNIELYSGRLVCVRDRFFFFFLFFLQYSSICAFVSVTAATICQLIGKSTDMKLICTFLNTFNWIVCINRPLWLKAGQQNGGKGNWKHVCSHVRRSSSNNWQKIFTNQYSAKSKLPQSSWLVLIVTLHSGLIVFPILIILYFCAVVHLTVCIWLFSLFIFLHLLCFYVKHDELPLYMKCAIKKIALFYWYFFLLLILLVN